MPQPDQLPERCCGRCRHARQSTPPFIVCTAAFERPASLPESLKLARYRMCETSGESCPAFENKETTDAD